MKEILFPLVVLQFAVLVFPAEAEQAATYAERQAQFEQAVIRGDVEAAKSLLGVHDFKPRLSGSNCSEHTICNLISYAAGDQSSVELVKLLHEAGAPIDEQDGGSGDTPIQRALLAENIEIAEYLAEQGADPLQTNRFGVPAFLFASGMGSPKLLETMLKAGAPVDLRWRMPDVVGGTRGEFVSDFTPSMMAAYMGRRDLIETLLNQGANPKLTDSKGRNLISYVRAGKKPETEREVVELANKHCHCKLGAE